MTLLEILVALGVIAVAMGSVLSIFMAGVRTGGRARERLEAGRVALAVFDLVDRGFTLGPSPPWYGRDRTTGKIADTTLPFTSQQFPGITDPPLPLQWSEWAPAYVLRSPVPLVWKYEIQALDPATADGIPLHRLSVTVAFDYDGSMTFTPDDRVVRVYEAVLADRRVP